MNETETRDLLNHILKDLFYKILRIQAKNVSQSSGDQISRTEMHVLETIEDTRNATMTDIADNMGISKATASVSIATLTKKGFLKKVKSEEDRRKSILILTDKGLTTSKNHQMFHEKMVNSVLGEFKIEGYPEVVKSLGALRDFFEEMEK